MTSAPRLLVLAAATMLSSCQTVGPEHAPPPVPVPAAYESEVAAADASPWWTRFDDPVLTRLIETALARNPSVQEAAALIAAARAEARQAGAAFRPQLSGGADLNAQRLSENGLQLANLPASVTPDLELEQYRADFDASWEIDLFGRGRRQAEAAGAEVGIAAADLAAARLSVAAETARNLFIHRGATARLQALRDVADASAEILRLTELRVQAGEASMIDLERARAQAEEDAARLPALEAEARGALLALDVLLGRAPGETVMAAPSPGPVGAPEVLGAGAPSDLLRSRPDIVRAERRLAVATGLEGVAVADLYPRFSLVGALGLESVEPGDFADAASRLWLAGLSISSPLLDGGRRRAEVDRRRAERDAAQAAYRRTVLEALSETETALITYREARRASSRAAAAAEAQTRRLALVRATEEAGESSMLDRLAIQRGVFLSADAALEAANRVQTAAVSAYKALGSTSGG